LLNAQNVARHLLDALGDAPAVLRSETESPEDQEIQSALGQIDSLWRHPLPFCFYKEDTLSLVEVQGGGGV
jgi:hypothetical protein